MGLLANSAKAYKRFRHSRGYGVHSPFAYNLVKNALHLPSGYSYYGYEDIDCFLLEEMTSGECPVNRQTARRILRLVSVLGCKHIVSSSHVIIPLLKVVASSVGVPFTENPSHIIYEDRALVIAGPDSEPEDIALALELHFPVFALTPDDEAARILKDYRKDGVLFEGKKRMLLVPNRNMAYVRYDMKL